MAITVEDGTGLSTADAYDSVANVDAYVLKYLGNGAQWSGASTAAKETAIVLATAFLDEMFELMWKGTRINSTMLLDWPRDNACDRDGYAVASTSVPLGVRNATAELAYRATASTFSSFLADVATADQGGIKKESVGVAGAITESFEYFGAKPTQVSFKSTYPKIYKQLQSLITGAGTAVRG